MHSVSGRRPSGDLRLCVDDVNWCTVPPVCGASTAYDDGLNLRICFAVLYREFADYFAVCLSFWCGFARFSLTIFFPSYSLRRELDQPDRTCFFSIEFLEYFDFFLFLFLGAECPIFTQQVIDCLLFVPLYYYCSFISSNSHHLRL